MGLVLTFHEKNAARIQCPNGESLVIVVEELKSNSVRLNFQGSKEFFEIFRAPDPRRQELINSYKKRRETMPELFQCPNCGGTLKANEMHSCEAQACRWCSRRLPFEMLIDNTCLDCALKLHDHDGAVAGSSPGNSAD